MATNCRVEMLQMLAPGQVDDEELGSAVINTFGKGVNDRLAKLAPLAARAIVQRYGALGLSERVDQAC